VTPKDQPVSEIELQGYLDGELSPQRVSAVEAYLEHDEAAAERLVHYGIQGDLIRRLYGPLINRPIPPAMIADLTATAATQTKFALPKRWLKSLLPALLAARPDFSRISLGRRGRK